MKQKPLVVVTRRLPDTIETRMRELFNASLNIDDRALTKEELIEVVKTAQVLVPTVTDEIDADIIAAAGDQLKLIANFGNGVDHIDVAAAQAKGIAVTNTYYLARLMRSSNPADKAVMDRVGVVFPNQQSWGTHVNVAGGAVARHSKNTPNAVKFLEYLVSPAAQNHFANGNNEWPVVQGLKLENPALKAMTGGGFKSELIPISAVGMNQIKVQQMLDRVGFK
jgi:ABC-type Fe3+ transport system substrate-binding protein